MPFLIIGRRAGVLYHRLLSTLYPETGLWNKERKINRFAHTGVEEVKLFSHI